MIRNAKYALKIGVPVLLFVIIAGYSLYETRNLIRGPILSVETPTNGATTYEPILLIQGEAKNIARIQLNDRQIFVDGQGIFKEKLLLSLGYNVMRVTAQDKFGRRTEKMVEVILKETENNVALRTQ